MNLARKKNQEDKIYKTIIIGFGKIAASYANDNKMSSYFNYSTHIQVLSDHPKFHVKAVVDPNKEALFNAKTNWGIPETAFSLDDLEDLNQFEIAILAIPPEDRLKIILKLPKLKGLVIEKPLANNLKEANEIIKICRERDILVQVNFTRRFDKKMIEIKNNLNKYFGDIQASFGIYGNGLNNNGSHLIDWSRMYLGEVNWVQSISKNDFKNDISIKKDINLSFVLGFKTGLKIFVQAIDFDKYREVYFDLWGTKGRGTFIQEGVFCSINKIKKNRFLENANEIENDKSLLKVMGQSNALYNLYDDFFESLNLQKEPLSNIDNAIQVLKIVKSLENSFLNKNKVINIT